MLIDIAASIPSNLRVIILIPFYSYFDSRLDNMKASYLRQRYQLLQFTLSSLANQSYRNFKVIVSTSQFAVDSIPSFLSEWEGILDITVQANPTLFVSKELSKKYHDADTLGLLFNFTDSLRQYSGLDLLTVRIDSDDLLVRSHVATLVQDALRNQKGHEKVYYHVVGFDELCYPNYQFVGHKDISHSSIGQALYVRNYKPGDFTLFTYGHAKLRTFLSPDTPIVGIYTKNIRGRSSFQSQDNLVHQSCAVMRGRNPSNLRLADYLGAPIPLVSIEDGSRPPSRYLTIPSHNYLAYEHESAWSGVYSLL